MLVCRYLSCFCHVLAGRKICIGNSASKHQLSRSVEKRDYLDDLAEGAATTDDPHSPGEGGGSCSSCEREQDDQARDKEVEELFRPLGNFMPEIALGTVDPRRNSLVCRVRVFSLMQLSMQQNAVTVGI